MTKERPSLRSLYLECAYKSYPQVCLSGKEILKTGVRHLALVVMGEWEWGKPGLTAGREVLGWVGRFPAILHRPSPMRGLPQDEGGCRDQNLV